MADAVGGRNEIIFHSILFIKLFFGLFAITEFYIFSIKSFTDRTNFYSYQTSMEQRRFNDDGYSRVVNLFRTFRIDRASIIRRND